MPALKGLHNPIRPFIPTVDNHYLVWFFVCFLDKSVKSPLQKFMMIVGTYKDR